MGKGVFFADLPRANQITDIGIVFRQQFDLAVIVIIKIATGIADVGDHDLRAVNKGGHHRRPHAFDFAMLIGVAVDFSVGFFGGFGDPTAIEVSEFVLGFMAEAFRQDVDGGFRGQIAFFRPAHAIADDQKRLVIRIHEDHGLVFVVLPYAPDIGFVGVSAVIYLAHLSLLMALARSCPQAASMPLPHSLRIVQLTPWELRYS